MIYQGYFIEVHPLYEEELLLVAGRLARPEEHRWVRESLFQTENIISAAYRICSKFHRTTSPTAPFAADDSCDICKVRWQSLTQRGSNYSRTTLILFFV